MFMPQQSVQNDCGNSIHNENVCWLVPQEPSCNQSRYKSSFSAKVRWDCWLEKKGCCKTIGPPPKVCGHCPAHFLRKHSRHVPVFFTQEELRTSRARAAEHLKRFEYQEPQLAKNRLPPLDTGISGHLFGHSSGDGNCPFPRPPSRLGLFRSPHEPSYEKRYKINLPQECVCDSNFWEDLLRATECAGVMAAEMERQNSKRQNGEPDSRSNGPTKDFIRSNAIQAIRMPARRMRRCYVDQSGVHLIDMSDSPYVLRPGFGKVPPYIYKRKMELLQKDMEAKRRMELREMVESAGVTNENVQLVNEEEKEAVIKGLKDYWADLLNQYNSLPLNDTGTEKQRELKHSLEERMKEIEQDLRLLTSSSMLFVGDVNESHYI